jgi:hypothetical protein
VRIVKFTVSVSKFTLGVSIPSSLSSELLGLQENKQRKEIKIKKSNKQFLF